MKIIEKIFVILPFVFVILFLYLIYVTEYVYLWDLKDVLTVLAISILFFLIENKMKYFYLILALVISFFISHPNYFTFFFVNFLIGVDLIVDFITSSIKIENLSLKNVMNIKNLPFFSSENTIKNLTTQKIEKENTPVFDSKPLNRVLKKPTFTPSYNQAEDTKLSIKDMLQEKKVFNPIENKEIQPLNDKLPEKEDTKEGILSKIFKEVLSDKTVENKNEAFKEEFVDLILSTDDGKENNLLEFFKKEFSIHSNDIEEIKRILLNAFLDDPRNFIETIVNENKDNLNAFFTHHLLLGGTGSGKTYMVKYLLLQYYKIVDHVIVFDIKDAEFSQILLPLKYYNLTQEEENWLKQYVGEENFKHWYEKGLAGIKLDNNENLKIQVVYNRASSNQFYSRVYALLNMLSKKNPNLKVISFLPNKIDISIVEKEIKIESVLEYLEGLSSDVELQIYNFFDKKLRSLGFPSGLEDTLKRVICSLNKHSKNERCHVVLIMLYLLKIVLGNMIKNNTKGKEFFETLYSLLFEKYAFFRDSPEVKKFFEMLEEKELYSFKRVLEEFYKELHKLLGPYRSIIPFNKKEKIKEAFEYIDEYKEEFLNDVKIRYPEGKTLTLVLTDIDALSSSIPAVIHETKPNTLIIIDELFNAFTKTGNPETDNNRKLIGSYIIRFLNIARSSNKTLFAISQGFETLDNFVINLNNLVQSFLNWYLFNPKTKNMTIGGVDLTLVGMLGNIQSAIRNKYGKSIWFFKTRLGKYFVVAKKHYIPHKPLEVYQKIVEKTLIKLRDL